MKMITANRLTDGRVIYRTADGSWTDDIAAGEALADEAADAALESAAAESATEVADVYLIEVEDDRPAGQKHLRESIRLKGPTTGSTKYVHGIKSGAGA